MTEEIIWPAPELKEWTTDKGKHRRYIGPIVDGCGPTVREGRSQYYNIWKIPYKCSVCDNLRFINLKTYEYYREHKLPITCNKRCEWELRGQALSRRVHQEDAVIDGVSYPATRVKGRWSVAMKCDNEHCGKVFYRIRAQASNATFNVFCSKDCQSGITRLCKTYGITAAEYHNAHRIHYHASQRLRNSNRKDGDLTINDIVEMWVNQDRRCAATGVKMTLKFLPTTKMANPDANASRMYQCSLDRKDNDKGYYRDNVHLVSLGYNYMKNNMTDEEAMDFLMQSSDSIRARAQPS